MFYYREGTSGWGPTVFDQTLSYPTAVWTTAPYTDASPDSWYASAVRYTYDNGLMNGTGEYSFEPESSMTRAMLVTVLWRIAGQPEPKAASSYSDVDASAYYAKAVLWASQNNIVSGRGESAFAPLATMTRQEMAVILYNYSVFKGAAEVTEPEASGHSTRYSRRRFAVSRRNIA